MRNMVGTRAEAPVAEQNNNCSPILSTRKKRAALDHLVFRVVNLALALTGPSVRVCNSALVISSLGIPTLGKGSLFAVPYQCGVYYLVPS